MTIIDLSKCVKNWESSKYPKTHGYYHLKLSESDLAELRQDATWGYVSFSTRDNASGWPFLFGCTQICMGVAIYIDGPPLPTQIERVCFRKEEY